MEYLPLSKLPRLTALTRITFASPGWMVIEPRILERTGEPDRVLEMSFQWFRRTY